MVESEQSPIVKWEQLAGLAGTSLGVFFLLAPLSQSCPLLHFPPALCGQEVERYSLVVSLLLVFWWDEELRLVRDLTCPCNISSPQPHPTAGRTAWAILGWVFFS